MSGPDSAARVSRAFPRQAHHYRTVLLATLDERDYIMQS
jgi:hypothetical protein